MSDSRRQHWDTAHDGRDDTELSWYQETPSRSLELIDHTGIGHEAPIIDVGGGTSHLVDALIERGYRDITVLDIAQGALESARQRLPAGARDTVEWIQADITVWKPTRTWDLWHDRAVFHFLTEVADREAYKVHLRNALRPGGHLVMATFGLDGPERCSGLPVRRYSAASLAVEMGDEFELVESVEEDHRTPGGAVQRFQFGRFVRACSFC